MKLIAISRKSFVISWLPSQRSAYFLAMVHLGYGASCEMGYRLWDPEARNIVCSNDVYFNEEKMHKRPIPTVEIRRE